MPMRRIFGIALIACVVGTSSAEAMQGFSCSVDDASLKLDASGAFSGGPGEGIMYFKAEAQFLLPGLPAYMRKLDMTKDLAHHWVDRDELRLRFRAEPTSGETVASIDLIIKTAGDTESDEMPGTYSIDIFNADGTGNTITASGKAACSTD